MPTPRLIIFDDGQGRFGPLTDLHAPFSITTGAINNRVRIECNLGIMAMDLRMYEVVAPLYRETESDALVNAPVRRTTLIRLHTRNPGEKWTPLTLAGDSDALLVNGRWTGEDDSLAAQVRGLPLWRAIVRADGTTIAVHLSCDEAQAFINRGFTLDPRTTCDTADEAVVIARPWDVLAALELTLRADLNRKTVPEWDRGRNSTVTCIGSHVIRVATTARIHPMTVLNSEKGPVVIDEEAIVGSFTVIAGPCYIGRHTIVQPHTHIRANTVVGEQSLIGGEISHSIILGYTNKAHTGYLGNSIVGKWCNLGADTNVSNLKNTYGNIRVRLAANSQEEDTGQTKLGPIIGDYTRTAIGSRLLTGSCLSTGTMLALSSFAPKFTPRFAFLTDKENTRYDIDKFLAAARKAMARRDKQMTPAEEERLRALCKEK